MSKTLTISEIITDEGETQRAIFVDGELFDWGIDPKELKKATRFAQDDASIKKAIHGDVQKFFVDSFCEFVDKKMTLKEINDAIESGTI